MASQSDEDHFLWPMGPQIKWPPPSSDSPPPTHSPLPIHSVPATPKDLLFVSSTWASTPGILNAWNVPFLFLIILTLAQRSPPQRGLGWPNLPTLSENLPDLALKVPRPGKPRNQTIWVGHTSEAIPGCSLQNKPHLLTPKLLPCYFSYKCGTCVPRRTVPGK